MASDLTKGIVRILDTGGNTIGTGFAVDDMRGLITTCAHVVKAAGAEPGGTVGIAFHATGEKCQANVDTEWWRAPDAEDITILRLGKPLPEGVKPLPLGSSRDSEGHPFKSRGYRLAKHFPAGLEAEGKVQTRTSYQNQPVLQLLTNQIDQGMSGAPIWDVKSRRVVGMVSFFWETERHVDGWLAFATPSETLHQVCPLVPLSDLCPYKGLAAFTEDDAEFFFGREALVTDLVTHLRSNPRFLVVVGPSGSGKSSVVQAGLFPALLRGKVPGSETWYRLIFRPGVDPFVALAATGLVITSESDLQAEVRTFLDCHPEAGRLVLIADQFEEFFALCHEPTQERFMRNLLDLLDSDLPMTVIVTLRADFYGYLLRYASLVEWLKVGQVNVPPMGPEELQAAIERPAEVVGLRFEPSLVASIVEEASQVKHALPLLQAALTQLWIQREEGALTNVAYRAVGRVTGAIGQWAEDTYSGLSGEEKRLAQRIFTRLVHYSKGDAADTCQRRTLAELIVRPEEREVVHRLAQKLADARLLVTDLEPGTGEETAEIIHDALLREWGRLQRWLTEQREFYLWRQRLDERMHEWKEKRQDKELLLRGRSLAEAETWTETHGDDLNPLEREFLEASVKAREKRHRVARRRVRVVIAGLVVVMMVFAGLAFFASQERNNAISAEAIADARRIEAEEAQAEAERQRNISQSQTIAAVAKGQLEIDAERSLLLAMEAIHAAHTFEAENVLREALIESRVRAVLPSCQNSTSACTVKDVAWSPDGARLASALSDGTIQLWDAEARQLIIILKTGADSVNSLSWSPDGTQLVSGASDGYVRLWDVGTGELTFPIDLSSPVNIVAWSPDGQMLAFVASDNLVQIWDFQTGQNMATLAGHQSAVTDVAWSPDGHHLASASHDNTARLWDVGTGQNIFTLEDHERAVTSVAWSPDGHQLASASYDRTVRLWDTEAGERLAILTSHKLEVNSVAWSPDGARLATGSCLELDGLSRCVRGEGRLWDAKTGQSLAILNGHAGALLSVAWRPNLAQLASASSDGTVRLWDAETGESLKTLPGHTGFVYDVAWSADGKQLASASQDKTIRIWNATSTLSTTVLAEHEGFASCVGWSPDGTQLASGSWNGAVRLWDVRTGKSTAILSGHTAPVNDVAYSPDGDGMYLASASDDGTVQVWGTGTRENIHVLDGHQGSVREVAWSPDGDQLASASSDRTVRLWDAKTGQNITTLADHEFAATSVAWSPDGRQLAYALEDNTIRLWDFETGQETSILAGHERLANEVAWSPDGRYLATASDDRTVRLWDAETDKGVTILTVHTDWATSVAWSPDGDRLASASYDRTVRLFYSRYNDLMDIARGQVTRHLSPEERQRYLGEEPIAIAP